MPLLKCTSKSAESFAECRASTAVMSCTKIRTRMTSSSSLGGRRRSKGAEQSSKTKRDSLCTSTYPRDPMSIGGESKKLQVR